MSQGWEPKVNASSNARREGLPTRKVKSMTDWRQHFTKNPGTMVVVAFGGGVLLASMLGGKSRNRYSARGRAAESPTPHAGTDHQANRALETWDNIKGALIGVAATRFKDYVGEIIPGFQVLCCCAVAGFIQPSV